MNKITSAKMDEIRQALCDSREFSKLFKTFDDRLNELLPVTQKDFRCKLYDIERTVNEIINISNDAGYQKGVQDAAKLTSTGGKARYMCLSVESHRKEVRGSGRSGWIYKICKVVKEYVDEAKADNDIARLKAGEISEYELAGHRT